MINAITSKDNKKQKGHKILKNVEKQLIQQRKNREANFELDDDLVDSFKVNFGI